MDDATVTAKLKADLTWIQKHERILLAMVAGVVLWFAIGKIDTLIANHDHARLTEAQATALIQEHKNEALAAAAQQAAAQYQALAEKVSAQNAALEQANVMMATALTKQQHADSIMPESELISRWATLVPTVSFDGTPAGPNGGFVINDERARATVIELEKIPVLNSELENERTQEENDRKLIDAGISEKQSLYAQVDGLKLQLGDNNKVCKAEVASVKAEARKSKRRWFLIGYIAGFLSRQVIKP